MLALFQLELKYYFKNLKEAIYIYGLFISIVCIAPFGFDQSAGQSQALAIAILWVALIVTITMGAMNLFGRDSSQGMLAYYQLLPTPLEHLVFAKWAAFYIFVTVPLLALIPITILLLNIPEALWSHVAFGLIVGAAALSAISSLASVLMAGLEKAGAMLALVILPLSIPVMIFGASYSQQAGGQSHPGLLAMLGFTLFLLPILCTAGASSIRASH